MLASRTQGGGLLQGMSFFLPLGDSGSGAVNTTPAMAAGSPTATFTRAGATAWTRGSNGAWTGPIAANTARSYYSSGGVYLGYLAEGAATNFFLNSNAVATQTITLGTGNFTCWLEGTGTITSAAGTATGTGFGAATAGSPNTINITVGGTVVYTVSGGTPTIAQVENGAFASSYIQTAGASVTRNADVLTYAISGNFSTAVGTVYMEAAPPVSSASISASPTILLGASAATPGPLYWQANGFTTSFDGTSAAQSAATVAANTVAKVGSSWGALGLRVALNAAVTTAAFDGVMDLATMQIGAFSTIRNVRIWTIQLTDAQLQGITT